MPSIVMIIEAVRNERELSPHKVVRPRVPLGVSFRVNITARLDDVSIPLLYATVDEPLEPPVEPGGKSGQSHTCKRRIGHGAYVSIRYKWMSRDREWKPDGTHGTLTYDLDADRSEGAQLVRGVLKEMRDAEAARRAAGPGFEASGANLMQIESNIENWDTKIAEAESRLAELRCGKEAAEARLADARIAGAEARRLDEALKMQRRAALRRAALRRAALQRAALRRAASAR